MSLSSIFGTGPAARGAWLGGARGAGLGGALAQGAEGFLAGQDQSRERIWQDKQRAQTSRWWDQANQEQDLNNTPAQEGETDADRLERMADLADSLGLGDKASKYRGKSKEMKEDLGYKKVAQAFQLLYGGDYAGATKLLNESGLAGNTQRIGPALDANSQPIPGKFSVQHVGPDGNPTTSVLDDRIIPILAANPKEFHQAAKDYQGGKDTEAWRKTQDQNTDQSREEKVRHSIATEAFQKYKAEHSGKGGSGSGKLTTYQDKKEWAFRQIAPNGERRFLSEADAMQWVVSSGLPMQEQALAARTAQINEDPAPIPKPALPGHGPGIIERGPTPPRDSTLGDAFLPPKAAAPSAASVDLSTFGFVPEKNQPGTWVNPKTSVRFRSNGGKMEAWSNKRKMWIPAE